MALLAEKVNADIQTIAKVMGMDGRISPKFLHAGPGYGGSCFPKDTKAIVEIGKNYGVEMKVISAAIEANQKQKNYMIDKIVNAMDKNKNLEGKIITILGLSFKPETDDMRDSPALDIIEGLVSCGAHIQAYCPEGMKEAQWRLQHLKSKITYYNNEYEAVTGADGLVIVTEWYQFRAMDLQRIHSTMRGNYFFDLRNVYSKKREFLGDFRYYGVGIGGN